MTISVEHLRSFIALADELHFGRAAARVYLSPSPFSKRIKELEESVGARLVERTTRSVRLTAAGVAFLPRAQDVVSGFDALRWVVREEPAVGVPEIRVGLPPGGIHPADRDAVVSIVRRAVGPCKVELEPINPSDVKEALESGAVLFTVVATLRPVEVLESTIIRVEGYGVAVPAAHPAAAAEAVALTMLTDLRYATIEFRPPTFMHLALTEIVVDAGVREDFVIVRDVVELTDIVATQEAFTFVPLVSQTGYMRALQDPDIAIRPLADFGLQRFTSAVWLPERAAADPLLAAIVERLRQTFPAPTGADVSLPA